MSWTIRRHRTRKRNSIRTSAINYRRYSAARTSSSSSAQLPESAASVTSYLPQFDADGSLQNPTTYSAGTGGEIMLLTVMYEWPVFGGILGLNWGSFSNGTMLMTSTQIFRVES